MNKRITLLSDSHVKVRPHSAATWTVDVYFTCNGLNIPDAIGTADDEGLAALKDCLNCSATGSFAALADTSAVPFVGKMVRLKCDDGTWRIMGLDRDNQWHMVNGEECERTRFEHSRMLLPLTEPSPPTSLCFSELADGDFFRIETDTKQRVFLKHATKPFGNECATDEDCQLYLFKSETPCLAAKP